MLGWTEVSGGLTASSSLAETEEKKECTYIIATKHSIHTYIIHKSYTHEKVYVLFVYIPFSSVDHSCP